MAGGTTCLVDFIIPKKGQDLVEAYEEWSARAAGEAICDYSFHCAITYWDDDKIPRGMTRLVQEKGISSFKVFLAYKGTLQVEDEAILKILQNSKRLGAVTMAHCENADMVELGQQQMREAGVTGPEGHYWSRIDECEAEATHRMITLAHAVNAPLYVVHVMSELAADEVARGRQKGCILFGETLGKKKTTTKIHTTINLLHLFCQFTSFCIIQPPRWGWTADSSQIRTGDMLLVMLCLLPSTQIRTRRRSS